MQMNQVAVLCIGAALLILLAADSKTSFFYICLQII